MRIGAHPAALAVWVVFLLALLLSPRLEADAVRSALEGLGPFAPVAFVLAEAIQVVVIPIPGQPLEIPGGWYFGLGLGSVLASIGAVGGSLAAFALGRRYGRPWVEARVAPEVRARFDRHFGRGERAEWIVFLLMLVPAFPRDPLCYLAGLTRLTPARFAWIAVIGRPVGLVPWVALGARGVAYGLGLQLVLAAAAGAVWIGYRAVARRGDAAVLAGNETAAPAHPTGDGHA